MQRKKLMDLHIVKRRGDVPDVPQKDGWKVVRCYDAFVDDSTGEKVLIVDFFEPQTDTFIMRLFFDGKKWFFVLNDGSKSEASLRISGWGGYTYEPFSASADLIINRYVKALNVSSRSKDDQRSGIQMLSDYQDMVRDNRLEAKYQRIKESINREMLGVKPVPEKFKAWVEDKVLPSYLFYTYTKKKATDAQCSHCGNTVLISRPHKDDEMRCPHCKKTCVCKPIGAYKNSNGFHDEADAVYIQSITKGKICINRFSIQFYYNGDVVPHKYFHEEGRQLAEINGSSFKDKGTYTHEADYRGGDWRRDYYDVNPSKAYVYPSNLNRIFKSRPGFNQYHLDYNKIVRLCNPVSIMKVFQASAGVNSLMNLVNAGLINIAKDVIAEGPSYNKSKGLNYDDVEGLNDASAGSLRKAFGIAKEILPVLKEVNPTLEEYVLYKKYIQSGKRVSTADFKEYCAACRKTGSADRITDLLIKYSTIHQWIKYLLYLETVYFVKHRKDVPYWYSYNKYRYFLHDYFDYIRFASLLEMDLKDANILFPKNFKQKHDEFAAIVRDKDFRASELPQIARQYTEYNMKFSYCSDGLMIIPPKRHNDLKDEGKKLHHCVSTYAESVATGETIILFIRNEDSPDTPYFTLNIEPDTYEMIQCRGLKNCSYPAEVKKFIDKWYRERIEPLRRSQQLCQKTA